MINFTKKHNTTKGAALLLFVMFFMFVSLAVSFNLSRSVYSGLLTYRLVSETKQAHFSAESLAEDMAYRNIAALNVDMIESNNLFGASVTATTTIDNVDGLWTISAQSDNSGVVRAADIVLAQGSGASFNFGLQSGNGGILMTNSAEVFGNVFSNGEIIGNNGSLIRGEVISSGPDGYIEDVHATGTVWSHEINDLEVDGDAYYTLESAASVVHGDRYHPWPDQATVTLPIADSVVQMWQDNIDDAGTIIASTSPECAGGTYVIDTDMEIGDIKIDCNLQVDKNGTTLTLTGPVWVVGNISYTGPTIRASSSVGSRSVQMIAHDPDNTETSSKISVDNSTDFFGSVTSPKSYILVLSMNDSGENGGTEKAIDINNSANGDILLYAAHGIVELANNIDLKEVTGWRIDLGNNTDVIYESGLVSQLFTSGPGGGFTISDWIEI